MKRSGIPAVPPGDAGHAAFFHAVKDNIELLTGVRGDKLTPVPSTASLAEVIVALNKVIARLS